MEITVLIKSLSQRMKYEGLPASVIEKEPEPSFVKNHHFQSEKKSSCSSTFFCFVLFWVWTYVWSMTRFNTECCNNSVIEVEDFDQ